MLRISKIIFENFKFRMLLVDLKIFEKYTSIGLSLKVSLGIVFVSISKKLEKTTKLVKLIVAAKK